MSGFNNLAPATKRTRISDAVAAGVTTVQCPANATTGGANGLIDMQGFDGVLFVVAVGTTIATGTIQLQVTGGNDPAGADQANLIGAASTLLTPGAQAHGEFITLEVHKPNYRYLRLQVARAVANIVIDSVMMEQYGDRKNPENDDVTAGFGCLDECVAISPQPTNTQISTLTNTFGTIGRSVVTYRNAS